MVDKKKLSDLHNQEPTRIRLPKNNELVGIVEKRLGGSRMRVRTHKGDEILARVPGRVKKYLWIREGKYVLLEPWEFDKDKADLVYKFKPNEIKVLEKKGFLSNLEAIEEF
jgi:translation initiation factor 1A